MCVDMLMCSPCPPVFPNTPPSWSLDGENREQVSYMPASTGGVIMPPVPPRSFPSGTFSFYLTHKLYGLLGICTHISNWTLCDVFSPWTSLCRTLPDALWCVSPPEQRPSPRPACPLTSKGTAFRETLCKVVTTALFTSWKNCFESISVLYISS